MNHPNHPNPNLSAKYRPSLSGHNITTLVQVLRTIQQATNTPEIASCLRVLAPFLAKVEAGAVTASHIPTLPATRLTELSNHEIIQQLTGEAIQAEITPNLTELAAELAIPSPSPNTTICKEGELSIAGKSEERWKLAYTELMTLPNVEDILKVPIVSLVDAIEHAYLTIPLPKAITDVIEGPNSSHPNELGKIATYLYTNAGNK